jgi:predicted unusual protein kinase regulating ubiquinone biosynthesis (AarF/ABC1/UbiB family)
VGAIDLSNGFAQALKEELDLRIEAQNMTAVAAAATARGVPLSVRIPATHQSLCGANVLVMEHLDGRALGAIKPTEQIGDRQRRSRVRTLREAEFFPHGESLDAASVALKGRAQTAR